MWFLNPVCFNIGFLALIAFLQAVQILIIAAVILNAIPTPVSPFVQTLFPLSLYDVRPEREMLLYRLLVGMAIAAQIAWVFTLRQRLEEKALWKSFGLYTAWTFFWIAAQMFAAFKILLLGNVFWARALLYASMAGGILTQIFWPELKRISQWAYGYLTTGISSRPRWPWDLGFCVFFIFLLWPKDIHGVLGRMFLKDQFYHLDSILMSPGFAHLNGLVLNKDIISEYSIALPIILSTLLKATIGFGYAQAVGLVIGICLLYYAGLYMFVRHWLGSFSLAAVGVLLIVELQMFHWGVAPLVWQFPSATPLRHWPDLIFFVCIWRHIQTRKPKFLVAAAVATGLALSWMADVGVYMMVALLVYTAAFAWQERLRIVGLLKSCALHAAIAFATALGIVGILQPQAMFSVEFWHNTFEFAGLFLQGWGALPMTEGLKEKQFFALFMGFAIPIFYTGTLIFVGALWALRKIRFEHLFAVVLCVYGLGIYHYFIHRSGDSRNCAVCVPFVLLLLFWARLLAMRLGPRGAIFKMALLLWATLALLTNHVFTFYPNALNLSGSDWGAQAGAHKKEFDFTADAALIKSLVAPKQSAAVISSFETKILMQAQRPPFFYYTPLMESALMDSTQLRGTYLHTQARLKKTLDQMGSQHPPYIFVERKLMQGPLSANYQKEHPAFKALADHVLRHYQVKAEGQYLTAYQRKDK